MEISTRPFQKEDLSRCLAIEERTAPKNRYFADVADYFTTTRGELTVALADGEPAGFGKLTVLFDGSAWLELLRVHPDFQRRGMGMAIYRRYLAQIRELGCSRAAMYTGVRNVASAALAEKNGLHRGREFKGMTLEVAKAPKGKAAGLSLVPDKDRAAFLLEPCRQAFGDIMCINHTFYQMNEGTYGGFVSQGWLYEGQGCVLALGSRFQPGRALYIAGLRGDLEKGLCCAVEQARSRGVSRITAHFPRQDKAMEEFYLSQGFVQDPSDDVVMEGDF